MATFPCPSCARPLSAENTYRAWTVRCPHCATEFVPEEVARAEFDAKPHDPDAEERDLVDARARVYAPGVCLELNGWVFGFLIEVGAFVRALNALILLNNPGLRNPNDAPELELTLGLMFGLLGLPYALVLVLGGRALRELSSHSWALTASVLAVGSFLLLYVLCACAFVPIVFGVWGLIVVNNPTVRRAFEVSRAHGAQR
jgi:hypothetical protein